jgi:MIP family channel proteins
VNEDVKGAIAELIGTFMLTFVGAGSVAIGVAALEGVAFAHGLILVVIVFTFGHISGAHVNPAVTVGLWLGGKVKTTRAIYYLVAQFVGGAIAGYAIGLLTLNPGNYGQTVMTVGLRRGLIVEALLTFFLVSAVYQAAVYGKAGNLAPVAIGLTLTASILVGGPLTGASLNPARSFGPALAGGGLDSFWPYLVGPLVGGLAAGALHNWVFTGD